MDLTSQRGYSAPVIIIIALLLLALPVFYFVRDNNLSPFSSRNIQGASSVGNINSYPGFNVSIVSDSETWDLVEYLCKDLKECTLSLTSGRRLGTVSGGKTDLHEVVVGYTPKWDNYSYVKYFVRSGWYSQNKMFKVVDLGDAPGSEVRTISDGAVSYEVVIMPTKNLKNNFYSSAIFSDR